MTTMIRGNFWTARTAVAMLLAGILLPVGDLAADPFASAGPSVGAALHTPVDARGEAMGRAAVVNPQGPTAHWWNPAPLFFGSTISASYTSWDFYSPDYSWRPVAFRITGSGISVAYLQSKVDGRTHGQDGPHYSLEQHGMAVSLPQLIGLKERRLGWSLGMNRKQVDDHLPSNQSSATSYDWGTSASWIFHAPEALAGLSWLRLHATIVFKDRFCDPFGNPDHDAALKKTNIYGVGLEGRLDRLDLRWMLAFATQRYQEADYEELDRNHYGLEIILLSTLSFRAGQHGYRSSSIVNDDNSIWGAGLQHRFGRSGFVLRLDYAAHHWSVPGLADRNLDHWTFSVSKSFRPIP